MVIILESSACFGLRPFGKRNFHAPAEIIKPFESSAVNQVYWVAQILYQNLESLAIAGS
jgi:hypothetical protein